jgi:hypothetical protein
MIHFSTQKYLFFAICWLTKRRGKQKHGNSRKARKENSSFPYVRSDASHHAFATVTNKACIVTEIQSAFNFLRLRTEFEYRSFISSYEFYETALASWRARNMTWIFYSWMCPGIYYKAFHFDVVGEVYICHWFESRVSMKVGFGLITEFIGNP